MIVYVEENDFENEIFRLDEQIRLAMRPRDSQLKPSLRKFCQPLNYSFRNNPENGDVNKIDLVVCMGGDGTILHAAGLFQVIHSLIERIYSFVSLKQVLFCFLEKLPAGSLHSHGLTWLSLSFRL